MNADAPSLTRLLRSIDVDFLQLHGAERPTTIAAWEVGKPIIKSLGWGEAAQDRQLALAWDEAARRSETTASPLSAFLVDAHAPEQGGGTGKTAHWTSLFPRPQPLSKRPLILAGGLTPQNVGSAILATRADGVDTASGVEVAPGVKSAALVQEFASNARSAFEKG